MSSDSLPIVPPDQLITQQSSDSIGAAIAASEERAPDTIPGETTVAPKLLQGHVEKAAASYIGKIIAHRYRIVSVLGIGAVGSVFRAQHMQLGTIAAVKVLNSNMATNQNAVRRFTREAKAASSLKHRNIASVTDFGLSEDGSSYLVMDFIEGKSLATLVSGGKALHWQRALNLASQICDAMAYAHSKNLVHRDLKPANIIITEENGQEKAVVVDFGIAKIVGDEENEQRLTAVGKTCGSPLYMSPEQCLGKPLDGRSDIYSLGCLLYEVVAGKLPFSGTNAVQTIMMQVNEKAQPLHTVAPGLVVPAGLENLILKCLQKSVDMRFQTMLEVKAELDNLGSAAIGGTPGSESFSVGSVVAGRYKMTMVLSENEFGKNYQAEHIIDKKQYSIEVISDHLDGSESSLDKFAEEVQSLSQLVHPNLTKYKEIGLTESGAPYFISDLGRGENLARLIEREGSMSLERILRISHQLCDALTYLMGQALTVPVLTVSDIVLKNIGRDDEYPVIAKLGAQKVIHVTDASSNLIFASVIKPFGELLFKLSTGHTFTAVSQTDSQDFQIPNALRKIVLKCLGSEGEHYSSIGALKSEVDALKKAIVKGGAGEVDTSTELLPIGQNAMLTAGRETGLSARDLENTGPQSALRDSLPSAAAKKSTASPSYPFAAPPGAAASAVPPAAAAPPAAAPPAAAPLMASRPASPRPAATLHAMPSSVLPGQAQPAQHQHSQPQSAQMPLAQPQAAHSTPVAPAVPPAQHVPESLLQAGRMKALPEQYSNPSRSASAQPFAASVNSNARSVHRTTESAPPAANNSNVLIGILCSLLILALIVIGVFMMQSSHSPSSTSTTVYTVSPVKSP